MPTNELRLGTAGWGIPRLVSDHFPAKGTGLERYAARFNAVEINSTFYRSHRPSTYARWAQATPAHFRFAVKAPRTITHEARLIGCEALFGAFRTEARQVGDKWEVLLVQLPPSLGFDADIAEAFFLMLRQAEPLTRVACEPRHPTWFSARADGLLNRYQVARVAADPAPHPDAGAPGGWQGFAYHRLHGSPRMYASPYEPAALQRLARRLARAPAGSWCIFDNTTLGAAAANALELAAHLSGEVPAGTGAQGVE